MGRGQERQPVAMSGNDRGRYAWRTFEFSLDLARGNYQVASRATDAAGRQQAEWRTPHAGGYGNTRWRDHAIQVEVLA